MLYISVCICSFLVVLSSARTHITNPFSYEIDQCKDICSDSFFLLPLNKDSQIICQRGCRFFNIIETKDHSLNDTSRECHISCAESYANSEAKGSCRIGCDTMSKKKQSDLHKFFPYLEQYSTEEQEFDSLEAEIFLDPLIRKHMEFDLQYKIPEAYIRTMPIDDNDLDMMDINEVPYKQYQNEMLCKSIIPMIIFVMILLGITLCIFKIIQLVQAIRKHRAVAKHVHDKIGLNNDEDTYFMHNCTNPKYSLYGIPGITFVVNLPDKKGPDATTDSVIERN